MKNRSMFLCVVAGAIALACAAAPIAIARASGRQQIAGQASTQAQSQSSAAGAKDAAQDPRFAQFVYDVASIKPQKTPPPGGMNVHQTPDGYSLKSVPLTWLVSTAYYTEHSQISDTGLPGWLQSERYDVEAKMDPEFADALQKLSPDDQKLARKHMMQALLRDRFKLAAHVETREVPIYALVVGKNGPKLTPTKDPNPARHMMGTMANGAFVMTFQGAPISMLLANLSAQMHRPVYDKTGLPGNYDFTVKYSLEQTMTAGPAGVASDPSLDSAPPLSEAVEEQLGLKLVSAKGPMDYIVIDHVERPSPN